MNTLRVWLIHRLGGVERPLPTTMPWTGTSRSFNAAPNSVIIRTSWPDYANAWPGYVPTKRKRRWHR